MIYDQKEILGKLFRGYINIRLNPQSQYRKEAVANVSEALSELKVSGVTFDELAENGTLQGLLMLTDSGMKEFVRFVDQFIACGYDDKNNMSDIVDEQIRIAQWVNEHRKELIR